MANNRQTESKSKAAAPGRLLFYSLTGIVLFSVGCGPKPQAMDFFIDAVVLKELEQNEMAVQKLNSAVEIDHGFWLAYSMLGEIYEEIREYEKSAASYERAAELNPRSFKDYFNLGRVYQLMKKFALAVKAYVKACEINPGHFEAHLNAAKSYYELKDYNGALAYGHRAEQIDPNVSEVQKLLGGIYDLQRDYEAAIRSYKRSLEIDSNDTEVMSSLAIAYLQTERYEPAKELLADVVIIEPANIAAYQQLGYCHLRLNDLDSAIDSYGRAIAIDGKDWQSIRGLGVAYMLKSLSNKDDTLKAKAVEQWRLSLAINPNQPRSNKLVELIEKYSK
jgi:protein O-GlcNAc transferase